MLGLPKGRVTLPIAHTFTALDKDWDAIDAAHSGQTLFDFGLGHRYSRFGVRASGKLAVELQIVVGQSWCAVLALLGGAIIAESPTRVVESELARIEDSRPFRSLTVNHRRARIHISYLNFCYGTKRSRRRWRSPNTLLR